MQWCVSPGTSVCESTCTVLIDNVQIQSHPDTMWFWWYVTLWIHIFSDKLPSITMQSVNNIKHYLAKWPVVPPGKKETQKQFSLPMGSVVLLSVTIIHWVVLEVKNRKWPVDPISSVPLLFVVLFPLLCSNMLCSSSTFQCWAPQLPDWVTRGRYGSEKMHPTKDSSFFFFRHCTTLLFFFILSIIS